MKTCSPGLRGLVFAFALVACLPLVAAPTAHAAPLGADLVRSVDDVFQHTLTTARGWLLDAFEGFRPASEAKTQPSSSNGSGNGNGSSSGGSTGASLDPDGSA